MAAHLHLSPKLAQDALFVDEEGRALDSHEASPIETFLLPHAVGLDDLALLVRDEREGKVIFLLELGVAFDAVLRNPDDIDILSLQRGIRIAKPTRLLRAARRQILWIEIKNDLLAAEFFERELAVVIGGQREIGGLVALFKCHRTFPPPGSLSGF